ncbi:MAG: 50S ribosomal protein L9 [Candidatus Nealsonbacteria bacterium]|nr:50S ribosomal protein L9 [Candidatus Nealsonbacteria bacterium]
MKVILLKEVEKVGKMFEIKTVKNGYARNFLLPNGLAKPATREAIKWVEMQKEILEKKAEEELKKVQETVSKIDGLEVLISVKIGEENQLFEKITSQKIAEKIKELGYKVDKKQISLEKPIDSIGEYPVKIKFADNLEADIKIIITEEKE